MAKIPGLPTAWKRALWWTVAGISIAGVLVVGAWVLDQKVIHEGMVMRNVTLDGEAVGGLGPADLDARLAAIAEDVADDVLTVDLPERVITATNATAGVTADVTATRAALMEQGRSGNLVEQFEAWAAVLPRAGGPRSGVHLRPGHARRLGRRPAGRPLERPRRADLHRRLRVDRGAARRRRRLPRRRDRRRRRRRRVHHPVVTLHGGGRLDPDPTTGHAGGGG